MGGVSKYYHAAGASEQGSPEKSPGLPKCDTYMYILYRRFAVKEGKKSWACLEKFHFCAPEYYRAGTRMAAQQQQKSYNRPLHFFPYKIAILLSPESAHIEFFYHSFITLFHVKRPVCTAA